MVQPLLEWQFQSPELEVQERRRAAVARAFADGHPQAGIAETVAELASRALLPVALHSPAANFAVRVRQVVPRQQSASAIRRR